MKRGGYDSWMEGRRGVLRLLGIKLVWGNGVGT